MNPSALPSKPRVLVIDDSVQLLEVFKSILEKMGYEIIISASPKDIPSLVQNYKIDVLFLDVFLKSINGKIVCAALKADPRTNYFPIILMSANPSHIRDFREYGADDAIEKPFDLKLLVEKINSFTSQRV